MKKKFLTFMFAAILCIALAVPCFAGGVRCVDEAGLLDDYELQSVIEKLDEVSEKHNVDVTVLTVRSTNGENTADFADNYYDDSDWGQGLSRDGVMLMISMGDREWYISTCGEGISSITDYGISYIGNEIIYELSEGDYAEAFEHYADICDRMLTQAEEGSPYDVNNQVVEEVEEEEQGGFSPEGGLMSLFMGVLTALFPTLSMKNNLKSVNNQVKASNYVKEGSLNFVENTDSFMYRHVASVPIVRDDGPGGSSTHVSMGGMTHGGGGGKF